MIQKCGSLLRNVPNKDKIIQSICKASHCFDWNEAKSIKLGRDTVFDLKIINAAMRAADKQVSDHDLSTIHTVNDLFKYVSKSEPINGAKGVPSIEIFSGEAQPFNVTFINYRKKKWTSDMMLSFLKKSLLKIGIKQA